MKKTNRAICALLTLVMLIVFVPGVALRTSAEEPAADVPAATEGQETGGEQTTEGEPTVEGEPTNGGEQTGGDQTGGEQTVECEPTTEGEPNTESQTTDGAKNAPATRESQSITLYFYSRPAYTTETSAYGITARVTGYDGDHLDWSVEGSSLEFVSERKDESGDFVGTFNIKSLGTATVKAKIPGSAPEVSHTEEITVIPCFTVSPDTVELAPGGQGDFITSVSPEGTSYTVKFNYMDYDGTGTTVSESGHVTVGSKTGMVYVGADFYYNSWEEPVWSEDLSVVVKKEDVTGITVTPENKTLDIGGTVTLEAKLQPDSLQDKSVKWESFDEDVVTITPTEDGKCVVTAVGPGYAVVRAVSNTDPSAIASCDIEVTNVSNELTVRVDPTSVEIAPGGFGYIGATVTGPSDKSKDVTWSSDNEDVATVDENGHVTVASGAADGSTATITATTVAEPHLTANCVVTVNSNPVLGVTASVTGAYETADGKRHIYSGNSATVLAEKYPEDSTSEIVWKSSDESIAKIVDGKVIGGSKSGTVKLTAVAKNNSGVKDTVELVVDNYTVTENNGAEWTKGSDKDLPFTIKFSENDIPIDEYDPAKVTKVEVLEDKVLTKDTDYKITQGSYKLTLLPKYLQTLKPGTYTFAMTVQNEIGAYVVKGTFVIKAQKSGGSVKTKDVTFVGLGLLLFCGSLAYVLWYRKTEKYRLRREAALARRASSRYSEFSGAYVERWREKMAERGKRRGK